MKADVGATIELKDVLLIAGNGETQVGTPVVEGARVVAEVIQHGRDKKILVFKYKSKTRYRRHQGHRQDFTRLAIREILAAGETAAVAEAKPARKRPGAKTKAKPVSAEAAAEAPVAEAPTAEPIAKPARARKTTAAAEKPAAKPKVARKAVAKPKAARKPVARASAEAKPKRATRVKPAAAQPEPPVEEETGNGD